VTINEQDRLLHELTRLNQSVSRVPWAILAMGLFLGSVLLLAIGQTVFSLAAFGLAMVCGLWMLFRG